MDRIDPKRARGRLLGVLLVGGALTAGCSGGGGDGGTEDTGPAVSFSFSTGSGAVAEAGGSLAVDVVLHLERATLGEEATVEVFDRATGTATSSADYAAFGPEVLSFSADAVDGEVRTVTLDALSDEAVEGPDETVRLGLRSQSQGELAGGPTEFVASITDDDVTTIAFSLSASSTPDENGGGHPVELVLDLAAGQSLEADVGVDCADAGTGSATSGADYVAFGVQSVGFPAGSADGATWSVTVEVIDDDVVELDETVVLTLGGASAGAVAGAGDHVVTIADDDALGDPFLLVTEGPTGVENTLAHEDTLDLGSQTVGAGPNAGTRLRLSNTGGSPMDLGAPVLGGSHPEDFVVEVELASNAPPAGGSTTDVEAPPADVPSPLVPLAASPTSGDPGPGLAVAVAEGAAEELFALSRARLHDFPVPGLGGVTLEIERLPLPIAPDAVLAVDGAPVPGGLADAVEGLSVWRGTVLEHPGSRAFLAFSEAGPAGYLELPFEHGRLVHLFPEEPATASRPARARVVHEEDLLATGASRPPLPCAGSRLPPGGASPPAGSAPAAGLEPPVDELDAPDCRLAIETDYQLYSRFGSVADTTAYVTELVSAVSDVYFTDVQTTLSIAYLGIHSSPSDPWTSQDSGGDAGDLLDEFRAAWAGNFPAPADLAHFVSGADLGGGIAYVDVLCNQTFGFAVSGNISGNIDWGSWTGSAGSFTWDFVVVAHELGHNFGTRHTHDYCPPLDHCYTNCDGSTSCSQGTLMSYCHTCGGMDNIDLRFHQVVANVLRQEVESSCLGDSSLAAGDHAQYLVRFSPLSSTGARQAELEFQHDAPNAPQPFRLFLTGTAD